MHLKKNIIVENSKAEVTWKLAGKIQSIKQN